MKAMFSDSVLPELVALAGSRRTVLRVLRMFGMAEATVGKLIEDLMARGRHPLVGITVSAGVISVRIQATGKNEGEAARLADADAAVVRRLLGSAIFGEGNVTLQSAVAELLFKSKQTVATAESCTGGLLAKSFTDVPGSSGYFLRGYVTYANQAKQDILGVPGEVLNTHGAVSEQAARTMVQSCRRLAKSDFAISVTGIAGPGGGREPEKPVGLVYMGFADENEVVVRRFTFGSYLSRADIRDRSVKTALNMLRLRLMEGGWRLGIGD